MRYSDLLATAVTNTFRSKLRTTLTVVAIFIGAFTLTLTSSVGTGVSDYIATQVASIGNGNSLTVTKTATASRSTGSGPARYDSTSTTSTGGPSTGQTVATLSPSDVEIIKTIPGITSVTKTVAVPSSYVEYGQSGKWVLSASASSGSVDLASGSQLANDSSSNQVILPTTYMENTGLGSAKEAIGRVVTIGVKDYAGILHAVQATVVGVQNTSLFASGATVNSALGTALIAEGNTGTPSTVAQVTTSVTATYASSASASTIEVIKESLTTAGYTGETVTDRLGTISTIITGIVDVLDAFAVIALIAAGFGIVNTLLMSVQERTREIGLMKAMGMGGRRIFSLFSLEAVFIGFLGSAIGAAAAIGLGTFLNEVLSQSLLSSLPGLNIMQFSVSSVITIILVVMGISFVAGTLPAGRAARQNPIDALRYE